MQEKIAMCNRAYFMFLLLGFAVMTPLWGQSQNPAQKQVFDEFDSRDFFGTAEPLNPQALESNRLMEIRRSNVRSFLAAAEKNMPGARMELNRFGVAKLFLRDGNSLSAPSQLAPEDIAKNFLLNNSAAYVFAPFEVDGLRVLGKDITKAATFLTFNQTIDGIDVFNGHIKFMLNNRGQIIQVATGDVAPGIRVSTTPRLGPEESVRKAFVLLNLNPPAELNRVSDVNGRVSFLNPGGSQYSSITAELSIFPVTASSARLAYRIFIEVDSEKWFELLIDAENGALLFRHNLYVYGAQANVWTVSPTYMGSRQMVNFPDDWLPSTSTVTTGNNVDAFLDADLPYDSPDSTPYTSGMFGGRAYSPGRIFDFPFADGLTGHYPKIYAPAAVTNLFYFVNLAHDYFYSLGFTETAWNFQANNFGRGGWGSDGVKAEAQYGGFKNNASFGVTPEGISPRLRVGLFTRVPTNPNDDLDADYDGTVILHEYGHGVSTRLVGAGFSTSCLSRVQSGAMGEGWSDYFAASFFNNPVSGAYITQDLEKGVRRHSYDGYPYTYEDIGNSGSYEVHNDGEIWAATLWDLHNTVGNTMGDLLVINGLKSTPCNPSMMAARDAILSADQAQYGGAHRTAIWQTFAQRGMGYSATGVDSVLPTGIRYDAAYDMPPDLQTLKNPVITSNPFSTKATVGIPYSYQIVATNPNDGVLNYELTSGPAGMTVDPTSGMVYWPSPSLIGSRVKITVTDGLGGKVIHGFYLPTIKILSVSVPVTISAPMNTIGIAQIVVPMSVPVLQVTLRNGSGSLGLTVISPSGESASSLNDGTTQTLTLANPETGLWQIQVNAYMDSSGAELKAEFITPTLLDSPSGVLSGLSSIGGNETLFRIPVSSNTKLLKIATSGGTGKVLISVRERYPAVCQPSPSVSSPCLRDYASTKPFTAQLVQVDNPDIGDWYISLLAVSAYSGVTLEYYKELEQPPVTISIPAGGATSNSTGNISDPIEVGYATLNANSDAPPYGTAVFSYSKDGITVSEAGVSAFAPTTSARIFIDYRLSAPAMPGNGNAGLIDVNTGIAVVNPGSSAARVTYTLRNVSGDRILASGSGYIAAGVHFARFIDALADEAPDFHLPPDFGTNSQFGSLQISSDQPLAVLALRGVVNQNHDFLLSTTPMADLAKPLSREPAYFPRFLDGGGYTTSLALMNTSSSVETGVFEIMDKNGAPLAITQAGGEGGSSFRYSIQPNGILRFQTSGSSADIRAGWVKLTPDPSTLTPIGTGVFSYNPGDRLISESGIESAIATTHARIFVDLSGNHNVGLAIANVGTYSSTITFHAYDMNGSTESGNSQGPLQLNANGYEALFVDGFVGELPSGFTGVLDISSSIPFAALTLRSLNNERNDFLLTTFPVADATRSAPSSIVFPHIVRGGGYSSQFILISPTQAADTDLSFFKENGTPWSVEE
jgi:hypothetical protein